METSEGQASRVAGRLTKLGLRFGLGGVLALVAPQVDVASVAILIGLILVGAGVGFVVLALDAQTGGKGMVPLLLGMVGLVTGGFLLIWPAMTPVSLIALLATYSLLNAVLMLVFGMQLRPIRGWIWLLAGSTVSASLAASIWYQVPLSGGSSIGALVGINLLTMGGCLVALQGFEVPAPSAEPA
ncbi:MAG: hypothetical protein GWP16_02690 [Nitrospirae bacterium]|nr:hypothetical protein [Nitrospirota bacterium]